MEAENKTRTIKSQVQPAGEGLHNKTFMSIPRGSPSKKTSGLSGSFQSEKNDSMVENTSFWMEQKRSSFPFLTGTKNNNWETADVCMSIYEEETIKATGRFNTPVDYWRCTTPSQISF